MQGGSMSPRVVLGAGEPECFRLREDNEQMPTLERFLRPMVDVEAATQALKPDFVAMLMPSSVLHPRAISHFSNVVLQLLERRMSVHLRLTTLQERDLPQDRSILTLIACPLGGSLAWYKGWPDNYVQRGGEIDDVVGDLTFENPRVQQGTNAGFVCALPDHDLVDGETRSFRGIANHQTGLHASDGEEVVAVDTTVDRLTTIYGPKNWIHPGKTDFPNTKAYSFYID
jgi:hypothetical protein